MRRRILCLFLGHRPLSISHGTCGRCGEFVNLYSEAEHRYLFGGDHDRCRSALSAARGEGGK